MPWQLIYTSARRGLQPGQSGYCTVAHSAGMRPLLAQQLEQLSAYDHIGQTSQSPVVSAYRQIDLAEQKCHVLSRIRDAGLDFSGRSNYLAHHLVFSPEEIARVPSPAAILLLWYGWLTQWTGEPRLLTDPPLTEFEALASRVFLPAHNWQTATGDAGRAAALLSPEFARGCLLTTRPGEEDLLLSLFAESLQLLNPTGRASANAWRHTFTSFVQAQDNLADFRWRGGWPGTPGFAKVKQAGGIVLEPRAIVAPLSELAIIAREGKVPVPVTQADVEPRRPAATSIATTLPPAKPRLLPVSPPKPSIKARLLERGHRSRHGLDTEIGLPSAPQEEHRSWLTWLLAFASSLLVCLLATYSLWKGALQDLKKPSPRTPLAPAPPAFPLPPANATSAPPPRLSTQGPIWLFLGKRCTDIKLKEVPLLTNLMSQMGGASSSADIHCILLKTNELATDLVFTEHGQPLPVTAQRQDRLHLDWHFRLGYEAEPRGVKWLPDPEEGKLSLNQEQTNFWTSITFAWTNRASGRPTNVSLALLNCRTGIVSSPFLFSKHDLIPDKSGADRYVPHCARFLEQFKLGEGFVWRLLPMDGSNSLYENWISNSIPRVGEEIDFPAIRAQLEKMIKQREQERESPLMAIAQTQAMIQNLSIQDLALGTWLQLPDPRLPSFNHYRQQVASDTRPIQVAFKDYLHQVVSGLHAGQRNGNQQQAREDRASVNAMLNANDIRGVCIYLDGRKRVQLAAKSPAERFFLETVLEREKKEAELKAAEASLKRLELTIDALKRQVGQVAEGRWETITELQLRIERKRSVSTKGETESVVFMKFQ